MKTKVLLVDIVLNRQQIVAHGLEGELMQDRRDRIESPIQNDELRASLVRTLCTDKDLAARANSYNKPQFKPLVEILTSPIVGSSAL